MMILLMLKTDLDIKKNFININIVILFLIKNIL